MPPGHMTHSSLSYLITKKPLPPFDTLKTNSYKDFKENEYLVTGSAASVTEQLLGIVKRLRVGNLMLLPHFGSMSHEETMENIDRLTKDVLPHLRGVWDDEGWENHWWPENCKQPARQAA